MEGLWEKTRGSVSVVGQDKGNAVPHPTPRLFLSRFRAFSQYARTILLDHTVWSVPRRMVRADRASRSASESRRGRFAASLLPIGAAAIGASCLLLSARIFQLRITLTDSSAPAGVYRLVAAPAGRGALVAACLPAVIARTGIARGYLREGDCPAGAEPVAKVIVGLPGDVVQVEAGWAAVNGFRFPNSRTVARDTAGRALAHVAWGSRRVAPGAVWLFGFNDVRSWDARYFGPVPAANVRGVLRPVVTW